MLLPKRFKRKKASSKEESPQIEKRKLHFYEEGYTMKKEYHADEIIVSQLDYVSTEDANGPLHYKTSLKYFFEPIEEEGKTRWREIFTGFIADDELTYFDLPYLSKEKETLTDYFEELEGVTLPNLSLLLYLNKVNEKKTEKTYKRTYPKK